ncbi:CBL-interacting serine/threonine-protein kinase 26-like [Aplysia californica]|uniref:CBL-interacting serine/threonine-protein kinase 26-like n=1 Tax=Aplysia californica TaxID=6500 RepID=A0ABM0JHJ4_APLCA|nr:CBL-interacting serine/threonine-protein kinase 26-like [Aplysia californica]
MFLSHSICFWSDITIYSFQVVLMSSVPLKVSLNVVQVEVVYDVFLYHRIHFSSVLHDGQRNKILLAGCNKKRDNKVVIKLMPILSHEDADRFIYEVCLMKLAADIPGVVTLSSVTRCDNNGYFIMPFYEKRDLLSQEGNLSHFSWFKVFVTMAVTLRRLHKKRIYYQDLRPQNILLTDSHVAFISDFGAASLLPKGSDKVDTWTAAPGFRGPEADQEGGPFCPFQLDTYSLAVSMWQVLSGLCPVKNKPLDHLDNIPPQYAPLLKKLLRPDPDKRWTLDKFLTEALVLRPDLTCFCLGFLDPDPSVPRSIDRQCYSS